MPISDLKPASCFKKVGAVRENDWKNRRMLKDNTWRNISRLIMLTWNGFVTWLKKKNLIFRVAGSFISERVHHSERLCWQINKDENRYWMAVILGPQMALLWNTPDSVVDVTTSVSNHFQKPLSLNTVGRYIYKFKLNLYLLCHGETMLWLNQIQKYTTFFGLGLILNGLR